jgi:hypothetical protein
MGELFLKKYNVTVLGIIGILLLVVAISGCTSNTQQYGTKIYQGSWKVDTAHFGGVPQEIIDAFQGNYVAYKNGTTITLVGTGKQISVQNDTEHQLKEVYTQDGSNVNTTYYLDGRLGGYSYTNQTTTDQMFDISKKIWEFSLTTAEENLSMELDNRTENIKL